MRTPTASRWVTDSSGSATRVNSVCGNPTSVADMCPWTTPNMRPIRTTTMLSRTTTLSRRSWLSVRRPRHPEVWSSRFVGEAMGRPTTPGNPSPRLCRGSILPSGVHPQEQDQDPRFGLGSTHPGDCSQGCLISALSSPLMCLEALVRPTNRPLLACSLPSFGDRVAIYPPLLNPEEDGPSFLLFVTPPPAESLGNQVGRLTFIFLSSWGLEAHTTLRNGCRCHRHCDF